MTAREPAIVVQLSLFVEGRYHVGVRRDRDDPGVEQAMADAAAAARAAFPDLDVPPDAFVAYVSERLSDDVPALDQLAQPSITDLYLACACHRNAPGAIAAFESRMAPVLRQVHATTRLPFDELVQLVRVHLFVGGAIASYRGRGRLASWLRVTSA